MGMIGLREVRVPSGSCPELLVLIMSRFVVFVSLLSGTVGVVSSFRLLVAGAFMYIRLWLLSVCASLYTLFEAMSGTFLNGRKRAAAVSMMRLFCVVVLLFSVCRSADPLLSLTMVM